MMTSMVARFTADPDDNIVKVADVKLVSSVQRACRMITGHKLDPELVDIIFHMFDTNHDDSLASKEFIQVSDPRHM